MRDILLVAGGSGALGRRVVAVARARGIPVRVLSRRAPGPAASDLAVDHRRADALDPASLRGVMDGVRVVFSAVGAPVTPRWSPWRGFARIDVPANRHLADAAAAAGVERFVYVSSFATGRVADTAYVRAHEAVASDLARRHFERVIIRPGGFFGSFDVFVQAAACGLVPQIGRGEVRLNPIAEEDLAEVCVDAALAPDPRDREVGGPEVLTRRQVAELACAAVGRKSRVLRVPAWAARAGAACLTPLHPRMAQMLGFAASIYRADMVAPAAGHRRLGDYFAELAARR